MPVLGTQVIKSIQRGNSTLSPNSSVAVTINSVDTGKSVLITNCINGYGTGNLSGSSSDGNAASAVTMGGWISGATSLNFASGYYKSYNTSYGQGGTQIFWEVIEYV